MNLDEEKLW